MFNCSKHNIGSEIKDTGSVTLVHADGKAIQAHELWSSKTGCKEEQEILEEILVMGSVRFCLCWNDIENDILVRHVKIQGTIKMSSMLLSHVMMDSRYRLTK